MKTRKRNTLLAIAIILLTIIGGAYAWSIKLSTAALCAGQSILALLRGVVSHES